MHELFAVQKTVEIIDDSTARMAELIARRNGFEARRLDESCNAFVQRVARELAAKCEEDQSDPEKAALAKRVLAVLNHPV